MSSLQVAPLSLPHHWDPTAVGVERYRDQSLDKTPDPLDPMVQQLLDDTLALGGGGLDGMQAIEVECSETN